MSVAYRRKELDEAEKRYSVIRDCLAGEIAVKARGATYLPVPNPAEGDKDRYAAYLKRATFYNVTKRTLDGLCGQIFVRDPVIEVPDKAMPFVREDVNGEGVDLVQLAKDAVGLTLGYGRAGVFVDYPAASGAQTQARIDAGDLRPVMKLYGPDKIINWRTEQRGARSVLSLVVLVDTEFSGEDVFIGRQSKQWRVLRLVDGVYRVEIWREDDKGGQSPYAGFMPTDAAGNVFTEIPFAFIGARNNDQIVDEPPMYDIAALNIAHYRNSADYEESVFMVGQPTPVFVGMTEEWLKNVLGGRILLGSRGAVSLPQGGDAKLLQASPNVMPFDAMVHKEKQMVALGARLVEQRAVVRTATEADIDKATETSVLASAAKNVASAMQWGLRKAALFVGADPQTVSFSLNTDFDIAAMAPEARRQLLSEWQGGLLAWSEARTALRKSGLAVLRDDEARAAIDAEMLERAVSEPDLGGADGEGA